MSPTEDIEAFSLDLGYSKVGIAKADIFSDYISTIQFGSYFKDHSQIKEVRAEWLGGQTGYVFSLPPVKWTIML